MQAFDTAGHRIDSPDLGRSAIRDTAPAGPGLHEGRVHSPGRARSCDSRRTLSGDRLPVEGCLRGQGRGGDP